MELTRPASAEYEAPASYDEVHTRFTASARICKLFVHIINYFRDSCLTHKGYGQSRRVSRRVTRVWRVSRGRDYARCPNKSIGAVVRFSRLAGAFSDFRFRLPMPRSCNAMAISTTVRSALALSMHRSAQRATTLGNAAPAVSMRRSKWLTTNVIREFVTIATFRSMLEIGMDTDGCN